MLQFLRWCIVCFSFLFIGWSAFQDDPRLRFAPAGMGVERVLFAKEEAWGIGLPGDNETGFMAFALADEAAQDLLNKGIEHFSSESREVKSFGPRKECIWSATPISINDLRWLKWTGDNVNSGPRLSNYLNQYGFGIDIPSDLEEEFNNAIRSPGSYFCYTGIGNGVILVAPAVKKTFYAYAG